MHLDAKTSVDKDSACTAHQKPTSFEQKTMSVEITPTAFALGTNFDTKRRKKLQGVLEAASTHPVARFLAPCPQRKCRQHRR